MNLNNLHFSCSSQHVIYLDSYVHVDIYFVSIYRYLLSFGHGKQWSFLRTAFTAAKNTKVYTALVLHYRYYKDYSYNVQKTHLSVKISIAHNLPSHPRCSVAAMSKYICLPATTLPNPVFTFTIHKLSMHYLLSKSSLSVIDI